MDAQTPPPPHPALPQMRCQRDPLACADGPFVSIAGGPKRRNFVLSIDGGGIYGLTSAYWLRQLCEADPRFLDKDHVDLFAGCSSGAINSLLLAQHANPREAVLGGDLERFWKDPRIFKNSDLLGSRFSFYGLSPWFSTSDFLAVLSDWFGDRTLADLPHPVLISTYNWTGATDTERVWETPWQAVFRALKGDGDGLFGPLVKEHGRQTRAGQTFRSWCPKFFDNAHWDRDCETRVVDVAYAASAPPGFRAIRGGLGDGASFNANPSVNAIAFVLRQWERGILDVLETPAGREAAAAAAHERPDDPELPDKVQARLLGELLRGTTLLSVGSGQDVPAYGFANVPWGFNLFGVLPTNPRQAVWASPTAYSLDAATIEAVFISKKLLHSDNMVRLNPDILPVPTVMAALIARNDTARNWLLSEIRKATLSARSRGAVEATLAVLRHSLWGEGQPVSKDQAALTDDLYGMTTDTADPFDGAPPPPLE